MYSVLYAISPEIFPAKDRGTGNGLTAMATRLFGVMVIRIFSRLQPPLIHFIQAPIIALYANLATAVPVYIAGALIVFAAVLTLLLPYEPRGKASI
jgi:hypothetical protein